jgi:hypothetical protein
VANKLDFSIFLTKFSVEFIGCKLKAHTTMDPRKFEYLETMREAIEQGDYEELKEYVKDIRESVQDDLDFQDLFQEVNSGKYNDVISLIDDIIYKDMQAEFNEFEEEEEEEARPGSDVSEFSLDFDFDEGIKEEISFEQFDDDGYLEKQEDDTF